ncbi:MAG: signal peptidase II [Candidatus Omnitrophota bacterium]
MMILIIISAIFFFDQLTKILASKLLVLNHSLPLIKGIIYLTLVHNRGAAFGIFKNQLWLFIFCAFFAIALIYVELKADKGARPFIYKLALGLICAGALGNLTDRILYGYVVDFLDLRIWPVFNIADSSVTVGAVLLAYSIIKLKIK